MASLSPAGDSFINGGNNKDVGYTALMISDGGVMYNDWAKVNRCNDEYVKRIIFNIMFCVGWGVKLSILSGW